MVKLRSEVKNNETKITLAEHQFKKLSISLFLPVGCDIVTIAIFRVYQWFQWF